MDVWFLGRAASAKALQCECACCILAGVGRPVWLEQSGPGGLVVKQSRTLRPLLPMSSACLLSVEKTLAKE